MPPRPRPRFRRTVLAAALGFATFLGAAALVQRCDLRVPSPGSPADRAPSARAWRSARSLARLEALGPVGARSPVVLNEIATANAEAFLDEDLEPSDWIELYNRSDRAVDLAGWSLSDGRRPRRRWMLPDVSLAPGVHLVVFASGKDRAGSGIARALDVVLDRDAAGELRVDADRARAVEAEPREEPVRSVRVALTAPGPGPWEVWLEARAVGRSPAQISVSVDGKPLARPLLRPSARRRHVRVLDAGGGAGERIVEVAAASGRVALERVSLVRPDAAEGPLAPVLHAAFRLRREGETVVLLDPHGRPADYMTPAGFAPGLTFQRVPDGGDELEWRPPTPLGGSIGPAPDTSATASLHERPFELRVGLPSGVDSLRYTKDGSVPTASSAELRGPLRIERPTAVRLRGFAGARPATAIATRQFWVGPLPDAEVVMVALDPALLWDPEVGIVPNNAGRGDLWERAAHLLLFDRDSVHLDGGAGLRTQAGAGTDRGRHTSFQVRLRPARGPERLARDPFRPVFAAPPPDRVIFDAQPVAFADRLAYELVREAGGFAPRSRPALLFLNGELHNAVMMIEDVDVDFLAARFGHADFDLVKGKPFRVIQGDLERLRALGARLARADLTADGVREEVDLDAALAIHFAAVFGDASEGGRYIDDVVQGYLAIDRRGRGTLHPIAWDLDHGFRVLGHDTLADIRRYARNGPWDSRFLPEKLIDELLTRDPAFRGEYRRAAQRFLDEFAAAPRWLAELDRLETFDLAWARPRLAGPDWPGSAAEAERFHAGRRAAFDRARRFFRERPGELRRHIEAALGSGG